MDELPEFLNSHFVDPYHRGECERATHCAQMVDAETQHFIVMQLRTNDDGVVEEAWFDSQGCAHCEGPASIMVHFCESKLVDQLMLLDQSTYLQITQLDQVAAVSSCHMLAWNVFQSALRGIDVDDIDHQGGHPMFGGPSLGEES